MSIKVRHIVCISILLFEIFGLIWFLPYLPMTDLPEHMLGAQILTHYDSPEAGYATYFTKHFPWNPYSSYFLFALAMKPLMGVDSATRLYIILGFGLTLISFWCWIRTAAPGRDAQVIPASLLLFGFFFYLGLINFLFSAPFLFFSLALSSKLQERERASRTIAIGLGLSLLAAYLSHIVTFGLCGLTILMQAVIVSRGRRFARLILPALPSVLLLLVYAMTQARSDVAALTVSWDPFLVRLETLLMPFNVFRDFQDHLWVFDWPLLGIWGLVVAIVIAGRVQRKGRAMKTRKAPSIRSAGAMGLFLIACTLLLPSTLSGGLGVGLRCSYFAAFAVLALLPSDWDEHRPLRWLMFAACAALPLVIASRLPDFEAEMAELKVVINQIPPAKIIQPVITSPHSASLRTYPYQHAAAWYSFYKGGISPYLFTTWAAHFPVRTKHPVAVNSPGEWSMPKFRYEENKLGTDYFLVRSSDEHILADLRKNLPLAASAGGWLVFGPNL